MPVPNRGWTKRFAAGLIFLITLFPAVALAETSLHSVRGFLPDLKFELISTNNEKVTQNDFKGKVVLMFFGYASCPDICPTTMAQLSEVVHQLGPDGDKVSILFISVDPHRDTPELLQAYVEAFDTNAIGLTGTEKNIANIARRYRVAYQIEKPSTNDSRHYDVSHSRGVYIFDAQGKARILASDSESIENLSKAVRDIL